jgi:hypothetical protein
VQIEDAAKSSFSIIDPFSIQAIGLANHYSLRFSSEPSSAVRHGNSTD